MGSSISTSRLMRARVNERLAQASRLPITLIVAPAGFGKSVALRDFIETTRLDAVRYDVPREDATVLAFVRGLSEALKPVAPSAFAAFAAMQQRVLASDEPVRQLSDWFDEHLKRTVCTIVIDDLHHAAADEDTIALLSSLIDRTSARIKWIIATRSDVGLPIATWVGYEKMDLPIREDELRFTADEALAAAQEAPSPIAPDDIEALRVQTDGWPIALAIALRTRTHASDLRTASAGTREMIYRFLAEQSFAGLSDEQRSFLLRTCVFSSFDADIAERLGVGSEFVDDLRRNVTFLGVSSPGRYRYHDLFRDFLESELRRAGDAVWNYTFTGAGQIMERRNEFVDALGLYVRAPDVDAILRVLEQQGVALFERGEAPTLATALAAVPDAIRGENASTLGLRAMLEASRGRFDLAELSFNRAIERAEDAALKNALIHRFAIELVRHESDCIDLLEPPALDPSVPARARIPMMGTLATAYVRAGRIDDAKLTIGRAIDLLDSTADDDVRARLLQQAAYVFQFTAVARARDYAEHAVELALARNLYDVAARAYSVLYTIANDERDDPIASLAILDKLDACARKAASQQVQLFGMIAAYGLEVERGDIAAIERIEPVIEEHHAALARARAEALLPALALRTSWDGEFQRAYTFISQTGDDQSNAERRALRHAEIALYAAAAGLGEEAEREVRAAAEALEASGEPSRRTVRSQLLLALAELVRGHATAAHRRLADAERALAPSMHRLRAFAAAVRALYRVQLEQADRATLAGALERLRAEHFGGLARLLEALPIGASSDKGFAQLTPAEREILQLLAGGASTKDVASKTGRSPATVDTHIRSLCRKLRCSGRREAVALAIRSGWVSA